MKKIIAALVALAIIGAPALAWTTIDTETHTSGMTYYSKFADVAGPDWPESGMEVTGVIQETIVNDGNMHMYESFQNPGNWEMHEYTFVEADGESSIDKAVWWWTESAA